ncbi:MAG: type IV pilus modification protein PilV [Granulosicoccus sp.]|nr:type IV pilus modification protein PilV [Granulosicoccus sp.]
MSLLNTHACSSPAAQPAAAGAVRSTRSCHRQTQGGVGLIEILIAVIIMSMGFLAAARMQVEGMRFSQSAYHQSQAYFLANDMIDRMRSNIPGVEQGHYSAETTSATASSPGCDVIQCNPLGIARQDLFDWSASLHPLQTVTGFIPALPGTATTPAQGEIIDMGNGVFAVVMRWNEIINGEDNQQSLRIQFALEES